MFLALKGFNFTYTDGIFFWFDCIGHISCYVKPTVTKFGEFYSVDGKFNLTINKKSQLILENELGFTIEKLFFTTQMPF